LPTLSPIVVTIARTHIGSFYLAMLTGFSPSHR